jgi:hypothetical protein
LDFTNARKVGPLAPGKYLVALEDKDSPCKLVGESVFDLNGTDAAKKLVVAVGAKEK